MKKMEREEVIKILESYDVNFEGYSPEETAEAVDITVAVLKTMTVWEYREKLIEIFHETGCDQFIALVALPEDISFDNLRSILETQYSPNRERCQKYMQVPGAEENRRSWLNPKHPYNRCIDEIVKPFLAGVRELLTEQKILSAMMKVRPWQVTYLDNGYADGHPVYDLAECPNCGRRFSKEDESSLWQAKHCVDCGQTLDWSIPCNTPTL